MTMLPAGPELDRRIITKVMGWKHITIDGHPRTYSSEKMVRPTMSTTRDFSPSTNIAHAWEAAEKLEIGVMPALGKRRGRWVAGFEGEGACSWFENYLGGHGVTWAEADTAPHAICLAALKAVGCK